MRVYQIPRNVLHPRVRVVPVRRASGGSAGGLVMLVGVLLSSFWLIRSEPHQIREAMGQAIKWMGGVADAFAGDGGRSEKMVLLPPQPLAPAERVRNGATGPAIYGRDDRRFIPDPNGFDALRTKVGESTTLRAMSFDPRALRRCEDRCEVAFRDHFGRTVTGVFFRDSHYDRLAASRGKVTITGLVQRAPDQTYVVYIQRVL